MEKPSFEALSEHFHGVQRIVELPGILTRLELPRNRWFRYDGDVDSLIANLAETECMIKGKIAPNKNRLERFIDAPVDYFARKDEVLNLRMARPDIDDLAAYHRHYPIGSRITAHVIAKKRGLEKSKSIFADGHESGEFLTAAGLKPILQSELDIHDIKIDTKSFEGEDFADIAGMMALRMAIDNGDTGIAVPVFRTRSCVLKVIRDAFGF